MKIGSATLLVALAMPSSASGVFAQTCDGPCDASRAVVAIAPLSPLPGMSSDAARAAVSAASPGDDGLEDD